MTKHYLARAPIGRIVCLGVLLFACAGFISAKPAAGQAAAQPGTQGTTASTSDSTTDFSIDNGIKTIHRKVTANEVVAVQIYFRGGSRNINEKNAGVESQMFEVAQQGTKNFNKGQINREIARMGTVVDS